MSASPKMVRPRSVVPAANGRSAPFLVNIGKRSPWPPMSNDVRPRRSDRGDIIFMGNLPTHKVAGVTEAIEAGDAIAIYLPDLAYGQQGTSATETNLSRLGNLTPIAPCRFCGNRLCQGQWRARSAAQKPLTDLGRPPMVGTFAQSGEKERFRHTYLKHFDDNFQTSSNPTLILHAYS
jgi:hypothetical protein